MTQRSSRRAFARTMASRQAFGRWLMAAAILLAVANVRGLDISQHGWRSLEKRAGYYTKGGQWKGGFPKSEHKTGHIFQSCSEVHSSGNFCQRWKREGGSVEATRQGTCDCETHTESYCKEWNCIGKETETRCRPEHGKICRFPRTSQGAQNCTCLEPADNKEYCLSWACTLDMTGKRAVQGEYLCLEASSSGAYCQQWVGHMPSDREEFSVLCRCQGYTDDYCRYGECETRTILRCNKHKGGWCNLSLSIFLFGGFGFVFLVSGTVVVFSDMFVVGSKTNRIVVFTVYVFLFVFPWGIGVGSSGGTKGILWVAAFWFISFVVVAFVSWKFKQPSPGDQDFLKWFSVLRSTRPHDEREQNTTPQKLTSPLLTEEETAPLVETRPELSTGNEEAGQSSRPPDLEIHRRDSHTGELLRG